METASGDTAAAREGSVATGLLRSAGGLLRALPAQEPTRSSIKPTAGVTMGQRVEFLTFVGCLILLVQKGESKKL